MEYIGDREWVEETLSRGGVPANGQTVIRGEGVGSLIKSSLVGDFPEVLSKEEVKYHDYRVNTDRRDFTIIQNYLNGEDNIIYSLEDSEGNNLVDNIHGLEQIKGFMAALGHLKVDYHIEYRKINEQ
jgi:hypothetical protein